MISESSDYQLKPQRRLKIYIGLLPGDLFRLETDIGQRLIDLGEFVARDTSGVYDCAGGPSFHVS